MSIGLPELIIILFILGILVLTAVITLGIVFGNRSGRQSNRPQSAREILDQRYARGELSKEQYEQMRRDIDG